jgi:hypothetical protein
MTIKEAYLRGNNLFSIGIVALSGFAFAPELFLETEGRFKIDEGLMLVYAIVGIVWYLTGRNRFMRSAMPIILIVLSLLTKIMAIVIEHKEADDVGDDFGALVLFVLATITVITLFVKSKNINEEQ